ncbi:monovalent cation/H(+) antiporter subunit G [Leucothrix arctica]|uniref:Sodium:proton antiporter n=1 Tax=Leucothrix arctica TaxID=1481894 RepID=A0A317C8C4_9GAMM|nr:monovalent cation/H(+) antiporter subunit G [Leucothrix arctica]PWQ93623.1 sodium:proton antiporter [Leucothrix arctica]
MTFIIDALSWVCLMMGCFLGISGAVGIFKFDEFYSRVHAASVTDTLCVFFIMAGLVLQSGFTLVSVKLIFAVVLLWLTSPVASHALIRSAYHTGLKPKLKTSRKESAKRGQS